MKRRNPRTFEELMAQPEGTENFLPEGLKFKVTYDSKETEARLRRMAKASQELEIKKRRR